MELSIIVPMYNSESTIERCLDSILNNRTFSYEVLLIDDGSVDNTTNICKRYNTINCVHYLRKENGGVSSARNFGLQRASGRYIFFLDSDDYIDILVLLSAYKLAAINNVDVLQLGFCEVNGKGKILTQNIVCEKVISSTDDLALVLTMLEFGYVWGKLYRTELLKNSNIKFNESLHFAEDRNFNLTLALKVCKIGLYNECGYYYVKGDNNTLSAKYVSNIIETYKIIRKSYYNLFAKYPSYKVFFYKKNMKLEISSIISEIRNMYKTSSPITKWEKKTRIRNIINSNKIEQIFTVSKEEGPKKLSDKLFVRILLTKNVNIINFSFSIIQKLVPLKYLFKR